MSEARRIIPELTRDDERLYDISRGPGCLKKKKKKKKPSKKKPSPKKPSRRKK